MVLDSVCPVAHRGLRPINWLETLLYEELANKIPPSAADPSQLQYGTVCDERDIG